MKNYCMGCMKASPPGEPCPDCGFEEASYEYRPHQLKPRTILSHTYLVGRVLRESGTGITYLGISLDTERKVAIKEYYPAGFAARENSESRKVTILPGTKGGLFLRGREKFAGEARQLAKFKELPGIVSVLDSFQENDTVYVVTGFIEGKTLRQAMRKEDGRLKAEQLFRRIKPVLESLQRIHEAGLIHRDINPDNLIMAEDGKLTLIDFGAAKDCLAEEETKLLAPGYAPIEQYQRDLHQGPWTDVYSLCATIYAAVTGIEPQKASDRVENDILKPPSKLGITLPENWETALMKGLRVACESRYLSIAELAQAFNAPSALEEPEPPRRKSRKKAGFFFVIVLAAAVIGWLNKNELGSLLKQIPPETEKATEALSEETDVTESEDITELETEPPTETESFTETETPTETETSAETETWTDSDGNIYTGIRINGVPEGLCTIQYTNGDKFEGEFKNGLKNGTGTYSWSNGDRYEGEYQDDIKNGTGTLYYSTGEYYKGEWQDDKMNGTGTYHWASGAYYEGEWQEGIKNGTGTYYYFNGDYYKGEWKDGKMNGTGTYYYSDGAYYEGEWQNDIKNGTGTYHWVNGDYYEGEWQNGKMNGTGTYHWNDGNYYEGEWQNDKRTGTGTLYAADGTVIYAGQWKDGELVSDSKSD